LSRTKRPRARPRAGRAAPRPSGAAAAAIPPLRVGCGADAHPLRPGRRLVLGGVEVPHTRGLAGHSDADVLSHAVCDALLGAAGLPDMGTRFPADDPRHLGRSSLEFLEEVMREVRALGFEIVNLDSVVLAEAPRLGPHIGQMRATLAAALGVAGDRVSVKAKRLEGLGAVGRREGIMAQAVVLLAGSSA